MPGCEITTIGEILQQASNDYKVELVSISCLVQTLSDSSLIKQLQGQTFYTNTELLSSRGERRVMCITYH